MFDVSSRTIDSSLSKCKCTGRKVLKAASYSMRRRHTSNNKSKRFVKLFYFISMTFKKVISISFLLLANIALLAHSAVFHHHDTPLSTDCHDHEHANKCCVFENCFLVLPFTKANDFTYKKPAFHNPVLIKHILPVIQVTQIPDTTNLPFRQNPSTPLYCSDFVSQSKRLRAPPTC